MTSQAATTLSVGEVALRLSMGASTVRRYADRYADSLSDGASRRPRTFSEADVQRIAEAARLTSQRRDSLEVSARLQALSVGEVLPPADSPTEPAETATDGPQWPTRVVDDLAQRIDAIQAAQRDRQVFFLYGLALGFLGMGIVLALFLALALLAGG